MLCIWKKDGAGVRCENCGEWRDKARARVCEKNETEPGIARKVSNYSKAVEKWIAAGSPMRTQEEIASIFSICEVCPRFTNEGRPRCKLCGCSVNKSPDGLWNKIAMATEGCPDNPPRWTADVNPSGTPPNATPE